MTSSKTARLRRAACVTLTLALAAGGAAFGVAAPAQAVPLPPSGGADGYVYVYDESDESYTSDDLFVELYDADGDYVTEVPADSTDDGYFAFLNLADGDYSVEAYSDDIAVEANSQDFTVADGDITSLDDIELTQATIDTSQVSVSIAGNAVVGSTVTGSTTGWPTGTTFTYSWGVGFGQSADELDSTTTSLVIPDEAVTGTVAFVVTGHLAGYKDDFVNGFMGTTVTAPKEAPVAAPVASSADLPAYLTAHDAAPAAASTAGLPTSMSPKKSYTANVSWMSHDSFVDVYVYSSPTSVGTFPVVNGVAQISLSSATLAALGGGSHTLVAIGQSSGGVQSVALSVSAALASTGFDPMLPMGIAAIFLLLGGSLLLVRRAQIMRAAAE